MKGKSQLASLVENREKENKRFESSNQLRSKFFYSLFSIFYERSEFAE